MIYTITVIVIFLAVLVLKKYKNKYVWTFVLQFAGLALTCLALLCYVSKLSFYPTNLYLERELLVRLYNLKINYYNISRIFNISTALFMYSMAVFSCIYGNLNKKNIFYIVVLAIPMLIYLWLNDPETTYMMYLATNGIDKVSSVYLFLSHIFAYFNIIILVVYMLFPLLRCFSVYRNIKILYNN